MHPRHSPAPRTSRPRPSRIRVWRQDEAKGATPPAPLMDPAITVFFPVERSDDVPHKRQARLNLLLMRERMRGQAGARGYSLTRHIQLKRAIDAEQGHKPAENSTKRRPHRERRSTCSR